MKLVPVRKEKHKTEIGRIGYVKIYKIKRKVNMGMKPVEMISLIAMLVFLIAPWFLAGLAIWGWLFVGVAILVLGFEGYSTIKNDKTISQIFWEFKKNHPTGAWITFGLSTIGWLLLGYHLLG
jgi:hypothetical protein